MAESGLVKQAVVVDGATGYVGSHLVARLRQSGAVVRCLVRLSASQGDLDFLRSTGAEVVQADLGDTSPEAARAFAGASCLVHLIGSIAPVKGESLEYLHEELTAQMVEQCRANGVSRIVMVTALGTAPGASSLYHRTKWQAEEVVRSSGLDYVILRPSLIVGRTVGRRDSKLVKRLSEIIVRGRAVPLINGGINRLQPVFIGDLVEALASCIAGESPPEGTLEIGGRDIVTMRELVEALMVVLAVHKPIVGLPGFVARGIAAACEALQPVPLLSRDQVIMANEDNVCQDNALVCVFGINPTPLSEALATYAGDRAPAPTAEVRRASS